MNTTTINNGQRVTILDNCDYSNRVKGMQGIAVGVKDYGVEVHLNVFPTLPYQDNIYFFPLTAIK